MPSLALSSYFGVGRSEGEGRAMSYVSSSLWDGVGREGVGMIASLVFSSSLCQTAPRGPSLLLLRNDIAFCFVSTDSAVDALFLFGSLITVTLVS